MKQSGRKDRVVPRAGQESVWDYPRPAICEPTSRRIGVIFGGETIADTMGAYRVLETSHPPGYYIPPTDINWDYLRGEARRSFCEWKGTARYWSVAAGGRVAQNAAWSYPEPSSEFLGMRDFVAFYPAMMDACYVDDERVTPQPGAFYGGWITSDVVGPFKGEPGTEFW